VFAPSEQVFFFGIGEKTLPLRPLKDQLEAPARVRPETEEGQVAAYAQILQNIDTLKELGRIQLDTRPGIYIYEIVHRDYRQTERHTKACGRPCLVSEVLAVPV